MNLGGPWRKLVLFVLVCGGLAKNAFACHEVSSSVETAHPEADSRTFLIDLHLDKSGSVRAVQVWMGNGPLRSRAIKAASKRKYHPRPGFNPDLIAVVVKFPQGRKLEPNIREAMPAGVSSCVTGGAILWPMIPWVNKVLSSEPILPLLAPTPRSN